MAFIRFASVSVQPSWQADLQAITAFANGDRSVRAKAVALAVGSEYDLSAFPKDGNTNLLHVIQFLDDVIARCARSPCLWRAL